MTKTMLCALLAQKDFHQIRRLLVGMNPVDIARLLGELSGSDLPAAFRLLEKEKAGIAARAVIRRRDQECTG